jgi:threonylcarbamoyladenosine tRNA methylthiotransferase MtaB
MEDLERCGFSKGNETDSDIYIINTCTVTNNSDNKSGKIIRQAIRKNPNACIVVMGCVIEANREYDTDLVDIIIGNKDKNKVYELVEEYLHDKKHIKRLYPDFDSEFEDMFISDMPGRTRAFVKIQDGCNAFCAYCAIPYARGGIRSKDFDKVIDEVTNLVNNGYKEIVLTGIHTGKYGNDKYDLYNLLLDLLEIDKLKRIRISSIEIVEVDDRIISILSNEKIADHMHLPLQSGCDKILKLMNRRYDKKYYEDKINLIRSVNPNISITTDVIVGFPSETEEDFNETYEFCKKIGFSKIHVFPYSDRDGTESSKMKDKVNSEVKKERVKKLLDLSNKLELEYKKKFNNKTLSVLFERKKFLTYTGYSSNYIEVKKIGFYKLNNIYKVKYKC